MLTREYLEQLQNISEDELSTHERGYRDRCLSRGNNYYGRLRKEFPVHFNSFYNMQKRCVFLDIETDFTYDVDGFIEFILYVGEVPEGMNRPSVGRLNHDCGYVKGNFEWQALSDNCSEVATRNYDNNPRLSKGVEFQRCVNSDTLPRTIDSIIDSFKHTYRRKDIYKALRNMGINVSLDYKYAY